VRFDDALTSFSGGRESPVVISLSITCKKALIAVVERDGLLMGFSLIAGDLCLLLVESFVHLIEVSVTFAADSKTTSLRCSRYLLLLSGT